MTETPLPPARQETNFAAGEWTAVDAELEIDATPAERRTRLEQLLADGRVSRDQFERLRAAMDELDANDLERGRADPPASPWPRLGSAPSPRAPGILLVGALAIYAAVILLFTPFTHQLDEIKRVVLTGAVPLLLLAALPWLSPRSMPASMRHALAPLGIFVAVQFLAMVLRPQTWQMAERVFWMNTAAIALGVLMVRLIDTPARLRWVLRAIVGLGFATVIIGAFFMSPAMRDLYHKLLVWGQAHPESSVNTWATLTYTLSSSDYTFYSTVLSNDMYSQLMGSLVPLALALGFTDGSRWWRGTSFAAAMAMIWGLAMTADITGVGLFGIVGLPIFVALSIPLLRRFEAGQVRRAQVWMLAVCVATSVILAVGCFVRPLRYFSIASTPSEWTQGMSRIWWPAVAGWLFGSDYTHSHVDWHSVLLGWGPGAFRYLFPFHRASDYYDFGINNVTSSAHNCFLDLLDECGAIGAAAFCAVLVFAGCAGMRQIRARGVGTVPDNTRLFQWTQAGLFSAIAFNVSDSCIWPNMYWSVNLTTFWLLVGISLATSQLGLSAVAAAEADKETLGNSTIKADTPVRRLLHRAAFALAVVASIIFAVRSVPQAGNYWSGSVANAKGLRELDRVDYVKSEWEKMERLGKAEQEFLKAIALNPTFVTSYYKLGHVHYTRQLISRDSHELQKSIDSYHELAKFDPNYSEIHTNLAILSSAMAEKTSGTTRLQYRKEAANEAREAARQMQKANVLFLAAKVLEEYRSALIESGGASASAPEAQELRRVAREYLDTLLRVEPRLRELREEKKFYERKAREKLTEFAAEEAAAAGS